MTRHAVILAGGSGTRLWPASRRARPKQYLPLGAREDELLIAATARRAALVTDDALVVTAAGQVDLVRSALPGLPRDAVIAEPAARNTAAAIGLAALHVARRDVHGLLAVLPSDHHVGDEAAFARAMTSALDLAEARDAIVTIGIVPTGPETGFGYLEPGDAAGEGFAIRRFVEKPDSAAATRYVEGGWLWNAGMFFARASRILDELRLHLPETAAGLDRIAKGEALDEVYPTLPSISFDHGVMEKTTRAFGVRGAFGWSDVGSFAALADYRTPDAAGNVASGNVAFHDASGNVVLGDSDRAVALVGVSDLVVVQSGDGLLVVPRARAQEVREVVLALERAGLGRFV